MRYYQENTFKISLRQVENLMYKTYIFLNDLIEIPNHIEQKFATIGNKQSKI